MSEMNVFSEKTAENAAVSARDHAVLRSFVFFLVPDFSMIAFATAIEALRIANRMLNYDSYNWRLAALDGHPVDRLAA